MTRWLLLPGMGADTRLFDGLRPPLDFTVPRWPAHEPGDTLQSFSARLAASLGEDPDVVGGSSFGGMVALEVAALVRPKAAVLIGSCRGPQAIAPALRIVGRLGRRLPLGACRPRRWSFGLVQAWLGARTEAQERLLFDMASCTSADFLRWAIHAALAWHPTPLDVPVFHVHGDRDRIIPLDRVQPTRVVAGAGHVLALTHAAEVAAFLDDVFRRLAPPDQPAPEHPR